MSDDTGFMVSTIGHAARSNCCASSLFTGSSCDTQSRPKKRVSNLPRVPNLSNALAITSDMYVSINPSSVRGRSDLTNAIANTLCDGKLARSFDLSELQGAFVRFLEDGEVSDMLDDYFTKLIESMSLKCRKDTGPRASPLVRNIPKVNPPLSGIGDRRQRNNEASRRSRAAKKKEFEELICSVQHLEVENHELRIWVTEVCSAIKEAKTKLLHCHRTMNQSNID